MPALHPQARVVRCSCTTVAVRLRLLDDVVQAERVPNALLWHAGDALYAGLHVIRVGFFVGAVPTACFYQGQLRQGRSLVLEDELRQLVAFLLVIIDCSTFQRSELFLIEEHL
jgi:hypothetical protein